jgi:thymidylate synthase
MQPTKRDLRPVVVTIGGFTGKLPPENPAIRTALDIALSSIKKKYPVDITSLTIFPYKAWNRLGRPGCQQFSNRCVKHLLPRLRARDRRNQYGTYFERMMAYSGTRTAGPRTVNQLQHVIELLKKPRRPRESALQISCFDPAKDHTGQPVRGFPCLQQIGIALDNDRRFSLNAFYPTQFIFDRAYGNYLGLCQLADFISHETNLTFSHLNCFVGRPELGLVRKTDLVELFTVTSSVVAANPQEGEVP